MARTRRADSKVPVFRDSSATASGVDRSPPKPSPSPARKRKRAANDDDDGNDGDAERPAAAAPPAKPKTKRPALGVKAANPNSRDNSLARSVDKPEASSRLQKGKAKSLLHNESFPASEKDTSIAEHFSLIYDPKKAADTAREILGEKLNTQEVDKVCTLLKKGTAQDAADLISEKGLWSPELLNAFRTSTLVTLNLSSPSSPSGVFIPHTPPTHTLEILFQQHHFTSLTTLTLRNTPLTNDDTALLRLLPCLTTLDLCNTGVTTQSLYHLVCHRHTLKTLNISLNPGITDCARFVIAAFTALTELFLRGTDFAMPALRKLVEADLPRGCRLLSIPAPCIEYLNSRQERYAVDVPRGYVQDPTLVPAMTVPLLKSNLELHARVNRDVQVTGTKVELVSRLQAILWNRLTDAKILEVLGRA